MVILTRMKNQMKNLLSIVLLWGLLSTSLSASVHYLLAGQSKTLKLQQRVGTIFIAKDSVANYELLDDQTIVIYAKKNGSTSLVAYNSNNDVILDATINVDPVLSQVVHRLKKEFPNSNIVIDKYLAGESGERSVYVISGSVPDTTTRVRVIEFIGSMVGMGKKTLEYEVEGAKNKVDFMSRNTYDNIIDKINVAQESQVNVKLTFVEVSKEFTNALGIEWQSLTLDSMITKAGSDINSIGEFSLLGLKKGFDIGNITTVIRAINNDKMAKVLAEPNLSVLSGEAASFLVGGEIPVVKAGRNGDSSSVEYKEYGIKLNIGATVYENNRIRLLISDEFSSISGSYSFNDYDIPTLSTRKTSSTIDVADGENFVIAGLISEQDEEKLSKIPFLGDIPILGAFARSTSTSRSKTELVVFATVSIVKPNSGFDHVELPIFERTDSVNLFFNVNNNLAKQKTNSMPMSNESEKFMNYMGFIE